MSNESKQSLTIAVCGQLTIGQEELERVVRALNIVRPEAAGPAVMQSDRGIKVQREAEDQKPRLAYTMRETAEVLGVNYQTVHRLLKRGLLRSSGALRTKIIPRTEIDRFLKETMRSSF